MPSLRQFCAADRIPSIAALLIAFLAGCGDGTDPTPPPPPPSAVPASVAVAGGDSQEGEPGATVGAVSVVVKDANGAGVANVAVQFAVDSGGGSLATPSATTGANGIASGGRWTLGVEGPQVVVVTVGSLPKVKIRATARSAGTRTTLPVTGGTVKLDLPASVFNGLTIAVPAGTYSATTQWSITELPDVHPTLPAKVRQIGPALRVSNGQGFANNPFSITIPIRVRSDSAVAAFFRDPVSGAMELIPVVTRTDTSLVLMTQHVAADQMLLPDLPAAAPGTASEAAAPGAVEVILVGIATGDVRIKYNSSFRPGVDDWEFRNVGSFPKPGGFCAGATLSAIYHNYSRKAAKGALYGLYDSLPGIELDNPRGIKLATEVQRAMKWDDDLVIPEHLRRISVAEQVQIGNALWVRTQMEALALALLVTGKGQQLGVYAPGLTHGHAVVAHAIEWGTIYISDPNAPGTERQINFDEQHFIPFPFASNATEEPQYYNEAFVLSASALLPVRKLDALFGQLEAGTIGNGQYRVIDNEYLDPVDTVWRKIEGPVVTTSSRLTFRTMCRSCLIGRDPELSDQDRGLLVLYNGAGGLIANDLSDDQIGVEFPTAKGTNTYGLVSLTYPDDPTKDRFVFHAFNWAQVKTVDFTLKVSPEKPEPGQPITFTVENGGIGKSGNEYRWYFSDADPFNTSFSESSVTRSFTDPIGVAVMVELRDEKGVLARASISIGIAAWRITSITDQDELLGDDIEGSGPIHDLLERLLASPQSGLITIDDVAGGTELRLRVKKSGVWSANDCCPLPEYNAGAEMFTQLGVDPELTHQVGAFFAGWDRSYWSQTTDDLGSGQMTGQYVNGTTTYQIKDAGSQVGPRGGTRISASRTGTAMNGTITFTIWFINSESGKIEDTPDEFRFPFTAVRIR